MVYIYMLLTLAMGGSALARLLRQNGDSEGPQAPLALGGAVALLDFPTGS